MTVQIQLQLFPASDYGEEPETLTAGEREEIEHEAYCDLLYHVNDDLERII